MGQLRRKMAQARSLRPPPLDSWMIFWLGSEEDRQISSIAFSEAWRGPLFPFSLEEKLVGSNTFISSLVTWEAGNLSRMLETEPYFLHSYFYWTNIWAVTGWESCTHLPFPTGNDIASFYQWLCCSQVSPVLLLSNSKKVQLQLRHCWNYGAWDVIKKKLCSFLFWSSENQKKKSSDGSSSGHVEA